LMKVLVLSSSFPYPVDIGRKVIISGFLEYLVSVFGAENVVFAYIASPADSHVGARLSCGAFALPLDGIGRRIAGVAWQSIICRRHALQEMLLYSPQAAAQLRRLMQTTSPDLVVVDTVRMAQYVEAGAPLLPRSILYLDDLYSLRYRRMLMTMRAYPEVGLESVGTFARFLPAFMRRLARGQAIQQYLLRLESDLLEKREEELPHHFDSVLLLNAEEATRLSGQSGTKNVLTVKPLLRAHRNRLPRCFTGDPTYLFLGNLGYPANAYSLSLFMTQTLPGLIEADPHAKLIVVGRGADAQLKQQGRCWGAHVQFLDFVEDLAPLMATAAAMVVPLIYGSGLKMKVLDALYYGLPIVSTQCGIDGVPATPGSECFIEDDITAFVKPLTKLLDIDLNRRMSDCAQKLYAEQFAPEIVWSEYRKIFGTA
jgi:glycosyltransferase involved in cell wall biosynthesis